MDEFKGIIINSIDYKEKSKIVYLYTPYGHDSVLAGGAKTIKNSLLAFTVTLNVVSYLKSNNKLSHMLEFKLIDSYYEMASDIKNFDAISIIIKVIKAIPNDTNHNLAYNFIIKTLNEIRNGIDIKKAISIFLIKMLYVFGVNPNLSECAICKNKNIVFFDIYKGISYCNNHSSIENLDVIKVWIEYYYDKKDFKDYSEVNYDRLIDDLIKYYNINCNLKLR